MLSALDRECADLRKHLRLSLRQWKMYAEMEEGRDLEKDGDPEAVLYRTALAAANGSLLAEVERHKAKR